MEKEEHLMIVMKDLEEEEEEETEMVALEDAATEEAKLTEAGNKELEKIKELTENV
jgi:hypothetical protein